MNKKITLECSVCRARNYSTTKSIVPGIQAERMEIKKFCRKCNQHTIHRETK